MSKAAFQHPDADNVDPVDADHVSNPAVAFDAPPTCF
jgi:hypothetical protein